MGTDVNSIEDIERIWTDVAGEGSKVHLCDNPDCQFHRELVPAAWGPRDLAQVYQGDEIRQLRRYEWRLPRIRENINVCEHCNEDNVAIQKAWRTRGYIVPIDKIER